eukprot:CAMPEP_0194486690 /NCGR_PEP_ID=MMETSP0253-20130528/7243_1 /TAXON_ID=2966 /ORGANISM="Noctiluca scintillans" /LENGTH=168 /DNA_ID=CAMNT_0039326807 /DNA_START=3 /DNA_END=509 /DNA_ORIENTATION=-
MTELRVHHLPGDVPVGFTSPWKIDRHKDVFHVVEEVEFEPLVKKTLLADRVLSDRQSTCSEIRAGTLCCRSAIPVHRIDILSGVEDFDPDAEDALPDDLDFFTERIFDSDYGDFESSGVSIHRGWDPEDPDELDSLPDIPVRSQLQNAMDADGFPNPQRLVLLQPMSL